MSHQTNVSSSTNAVRAGMSLIEVTVALVIFISVLTAVMQFMIAARQVSSLGEAEDDLNLDGDRIMGKLSEDISQSGWHFPGGGAVSQNFTGDRGDRYFPYVEQQDNDNDETNSPGLQEGLGTQFPHTYRSADMVFLPDLAAPLPGSPNDFQTNFHAASFTYQAYLNSYFARSQELIFLRQINQPWVGNPKDYQPPTEKFSSLAAWSVPNNHDALGIAFPSGWIEVFDGNNNLMGYTARPPGPWTPPVPPPGYSTDTSHTALQAGLYGMPLLGGTMTLEDGNAVIDPTWETTATPDYTGDTTPPLREFMFAVIPSPVGLGRLVRTYLSTDVTAVTYGNEIGQYISKSGTTGMVIDQVLSDDVVRVLFDTYRTVAVLNVLDVNEVRVRLYLARRQTSDPRLIVHRTIECILLMRCKSSVVDKISDRGSLNGHLEFNY